MTQLKRGRKPVQDGKTNHMRWLEKHQMKNISITSETHQYITAYAIKHDLSLANALNEILIIQGIS